MPDNSPLAEFFDAPQGNTGDNQKSSNNAQGSGFIIDSSGYVVTANHVVAKATEIYVQVPGIREKLRAALIGTDARTDIAILKVESSAALRAVQFGQSRSHKVGDQVIAIGSPFGLDGSVSVGIISGLNRNVNSGPYDFIQTDAAINRGNAGGPLFNLAGDVIGIINSIYSPSGGNTGISFAVPSDIAQPIVNDLKKSGRVARGWLGVRIQTVDADIAASLGLQNAAGALVSEVTEGAPAKGAGVKKGDAITRVNGVSIEDSRDLARKIADLRPGEAVDLEINRNGKQLSLKVVLGTFPSEQQLAARQSTPSTSGGAGSAPVSSSSLIGLKLKDLSKKLRSTYKIAADLKEGAVVIDVAAGSESAKKGLQPGDVIVEVGSQKVADSKSALARIENIRSLGRGAVLLTTSRAGTQSFVAVPFAKK